MNAKELAAKFRMLSADEVDLLQQCVRTLRPEVVMLEGVSTEQWNQASEQYKKSLLEKGKRHIYPIALSDSPVVIINIGANIGTSTAAMLEANPEAFVFSVDLKAWPEERENLAACGLDAARVVRLLGDSSKIGRYFPYQVDMVFVDGGHDNDAVRGDIAAWLPKCRGIMAFHDYHHPRYAAKPNAHLDQIVDEAMAEWERIGEARYLVGFKRPR
jgi:predicted O-methyltransferase YrrM